MPLSSALSLPRSVATAELPQPEAALVTGFRALPVAAAEADAAGLLPCCANAASGCCGCAGPAVRRPLNAAPNVSSFCRPTSASIDSRLLLSCRA